MKWIKCSDQLPEYNKEVLYILHDDDKIWMGYVFDDNKDKRERAIKHKDKYPPRLIWIRYDMCILSPTYMHEEVEYWMELPKLPEKPNDNSISACCGVQSSDAPLCEYCD